MVILKLKNEVTELSKEDKLRLAGHDKVAIRSNLLRNSFPNYQCLVTEIKQTEGSLQISVIARASSVCVKGGGGVSLLLPVLFYP